MRRTNPQKLGSLCQQCSAIPPQTARQPLALRVRRAQAAIHASNRPSRVFTKRWASTSTTKPQAASTPQPPVPAPDAASAIEVSKPPREVAQGVDKALHDFISLVETQGPEKSAAAKALQTCLRAATSIHPHLKRVRSQQPASRLAALAMERRGTAPATDTELMNANLRISIAAHAIVAHPNVEMTQNLLELYVHTQAHLGRPETLPAVLELYAHKDKPVLKDGKVTYVPQNPNRADKAVEKGVADIALQTAIDAKHLDAALGITEAAFCVKAFKRQKLIKQGAGPFMTLVSLPFGILGLGTAYAHYWQNTMDVMTATAIGVSAISGYFFVVGGLGIIAKLSAKDQMRRVTWLPGTPLRYRWIREEEREALDKISCAWGFKETWRHGEETGPEWEGLREHMGYRQMILDRVEFMEGMN
ncbi:uncharacterized protein J7T54_005962 [Emericellopsis cladophorae]|uniref:Uncharacterized protein n=1 Tax=Emericellopsis cladophorae TaxID=2686198 RepID=A0A9P9Y925_9HYPO|nr:uncharacterized protein J7T54_005962 [Emericellopsis cladophorae]KAI6785628.1 hypothetical protein J7T54_005962 [Emericellopsis cladophorae]